MGDDVLGQGAFDIEALRGSRFDPSAVDVIFILNTEKEKKNEGIVRSRFNNKGRKGEEVG